MSVVPRDNLASIPRPASTTSLEDILRDAACFGAQEEIPTGLAHRALAREIADQNASLRRNFERSNRKRSVALWLGGLSAGTLTGASAAVLILAQLNGSVFQITPEAALLSAPPVQKSAAIISDNPDSSDSAAFTPATTEAYLPRPQKMAVTPVSLTSLRMPNSQSHMSAPQIPFHKELSKPIRVARVRETEESRTQRPSRHERTASASAPAKRPPIAQWKTETIEETEYQLVTTAYVTSPEAGNNSGENNQMLLTPVQMRVGLEPKESATQPGSSALQ